MPQLMPLKWVSSVFMFMMMLLVLVELFYYSENFNMLKSNKVELENVVMMKW
uniref:ATP synthase F0 subunit 8 n=1 Tax=Telamonia vlijmi TaxID=1112492 RepID=A0A060CUR8_TELVL|nr:ATP synthase F0 subunit 8 [Telamonia vlijmi]AIB04193.1 ATP synthase F0 subunit 8 [Telamonia vlijmi]